MEYLSIYLIFKFSHQLYGFLYVDFIHILLDLYLNNF